MKATSHLRITIFVVILTASACSEPTIEPTVARKPKVPRKPTIDTPTVQIETHGEFQTTVLTWMVGQDENFIGLVPKTPGTDLANVEVFVVRNGDRIAIDRKLDQSNMKVAHSTYGEYYWASHENNVLLINFIGAIPEIKPPFPLDVIIKY